MIARRRTAEGWHSLSSTNCRNQQFLEGLTHDSVVHLSKKTTTRPCESASSMSDLAIYRQLTREQWGHNLPCALMARISTLKPHWEAGLCALGFL